jgi:gluconolactonase
MQVTLVAEGLGFPEGPVVLPDGGLAVVEIRDGHVTRIDADGTKSVLAETGGGPNGAALAPDGALIVCNNGGYAWHVADGMSLPIGPAADYAGGSIQRISLESGRVETLLAAVDGRPLSAPNDIVFDAEGGFYFTDTGKHFAHHSDHGRICYMGPAGAWTAAAPLDQPNGIALSPDGSRLYAAETATARIWWWHVDSPGRLRGGETFYGAGGGNFLFSAPGYCYFDSMAMEADGRLCVGTLLKGGIAVIDADGGGHDHVDLGHIDPAITNLAFGGADMHDAYFTASATGRVFRTRWPRPGLRLHGQRA